MATENMHIFVTILTNKEEKWCNESTSCMILRDFGQSRYHWLQTIILFQQSLLCHTTQQQTLSK